MSRYKIVFTLFDNGKRNIIEAYCNENNILDSCKIGISILADRKIEPDDIDEIYITAFKDFEVIDGYLVLDIESCKSFSAYWEYENRIYHAENDVEYIRAVDHPNWMRLVNQESVKVGFYRLDKNIFAWAKKSGDWAAINIKTRAMIFSLLHEIKDDNTAQYALSEFSGEKLWI